MPKGIYESDWVIRKTIGKKKKDLSKVTYHSFTVVGVVVSGEDEGEIMENELYIKRAINQHEDNFPKTLEKYKVISVKLKKRIGEANG